MDNKFFNRDWKEIKRQRVEILTRVMWYYRPVSHFNIGKKSEFYSRTYYKELKTVNAQFVAENLITK